MILTPAQLDRTFDDITLVTEIIGPKIPMVQGLPLGNGRVRVFSEFALPSAPVLGVMAPSRY